MLTKNKIKTIKGLSKKKNRTEENLFVAEGPKTIEELTHHWTPTYIAATEEWLDRNYAKLRESKKLPKEIDVVSDNELQKISFQQTPQHVLALFEIPQEDNKTSSICHIAENELCLALDGVQDPGNVGTIIRLADWFGINHIFCTTETCDAFSPKVIQATMGAIARVHIHYIDLKEMLKACNCPIYGTNLDGENIYTKNLTHNGVIVMGNEGNGISNEINNLVDQKLYIPPFPQNREKVESLNVAIATAIVCGEFRRQQQTPR